MADVNLSIGITGDSSGAVDAAKQAKGALDSLNSVQVGKGVQDSVRTTANTVKELGRTSLSAVNGILPLDSGLKSVAGTALTGFDAIGKLAASGFSPLGLAITGVSLLLPLIIEQFKSTEKSAKELLDQIGNVEGLRKTNAELLNTVSILKNYSGASAEARKKISDLEKSKRQLEETQKKLNAQFAKTVEKNPAKVFRETNPELEKLIGNLNKLQSSINAVELNDIINGNTDTVENINRYIKRANINAVDFVAALGKSSKEIQRLADAGLNTKQIIGTLFQGFDFDNVPQLWNELSTAINGIIAQGEADILKTEAEGAKNRASQLDSQRRAIIAYYDGLKTVEEKRKQDLVDFALFEKSVRVQAEKDIQAAGAKGLEARIIRAEAEKKIEQTRLNELSQIWGAVGDAERAFFAEQAALYRQGEEQKAGYFDGAIQAFSAYAEKLENVNYATVAAEAAIAGFQNAAGQVTKDLYDMGAALAATGEAQMSLAQIAENAAKMVIKSVAMELSKTAIMEGGAAIWKGAIQIGEGIAKKDPTKISGGGKMIAAGTGLIALGGGAAVAAGALTGGGGGGSRAGGGERAERPAPVAGSVVNQTIELSGTYDPGSLELVRRFQERTADDLRRKGL